MTASRIAMAILLAVAANACGGDPGYTQEEVDALVAQAVEDAVDQAQDDFVSEAEAEAQIAAAEKQASLKAAVDTCVGQDSDPFVSVDEGGLFMEGEGDEDAGTSIERVVCILTELGIPDSVLGRMETTNSQMGLVEGSWDDYEAQWSYHPDNGLDIGIRVVD
jgi:hypothetical protein